MILHTVYYTASYPSEELCPRTDRPEYAFIGRSNVGKSSLINMLMERKNLAHVSGTPGKTQLINFFLVNDSWNIVDLPGYGYAKISKKKRKEWERMINTYLQRRAELQCAFILIDSNIPPQKIDIEFINSLGEMHVPFVIVYTKTDRSKPEQLEENITAFQNALLEHWEELPRQFRTSARERTGREEILNFIEEINEKVK